MCVVRKGKRHGTLFTVFSFFCGVPVGLPGGRVTWMRMSRRARCVAKMEVLDDDDEYQNPIIAATKMFSKP